MLMEKLWNCLPPRLATSGAEFLTLSLVDDSTTSESNIVLPFDTALLDLVGETARKSSLYQCSYHVLLRCCFAVSVAMRYSRLLVDSWPL